MEAGASPLVTFPGKFVEEALPADPAAQGVLGVGGPACAAGHGAEAFVDSAGHRAQRFVGECCVGRAEPFAERDDLVGGEGEGASRPSGDPVDVASLILVEGQQPLLLGEPEQSAEVGVCAAFEQGKHPIFLPFT